MLNIIKNILNTIEIDIEFNPIRKSLYVNALVRYIFNGKIIFIKFYKNMQYILFILSLFHYDNKN